MLNINYMAILKIIYSLLNFFYYALNISRWGVEVEKLLLSKHLLNCVDMSYEYYL